MVNIIPQYIFDNSGNSVGVFLPLEDWNAITEELQMKMPQWQKDLIDIRLAQYKNNPTDFLDWDTVAAQFDKKDEAV